MRKFLFTTLLLAVCHCVWAEQIELRLLNHWDNPDGTIERGYAGRSIWKWEEIPAGKKQMPAELRERYEEYGRINQEYGINGTVLNNVNAKPLMLTSDMLKKTAKIADILRPYGIKVYLSINFASPKALGEVATADPLDEDVQKWWAKKAKEIYKLIPDFGGFLVKANSEGEPGPMDYGRTHVDGANMLANALNPYGGIVMWRAFVYSAKSGEKNTEKSLAQRAYESDRANQAYEEFIRFDGQFADNVIIQIKNGPIDFQPREPVSPLFFALKKTKMMVEFQITQEYTGGSIQTCFLAPMWREFFDTLNMVDERPKLVGVAGVANIGDAENWTANDLAMANWYAFGRLANDTEASSIDIAEEFLKKNYSTDERFVRPMTQMLLKSREAVVDYMMPLGLHHIFAGGHHYGPEPWCNPRGWREDWLPKFYHRADSIGLGFNRTDHAEPCLADNEGSNNVSQYPEPFRTLYNNIRTCPENLLLWFHHVSWDYTMSNGLSMWDNLCYMYDRGVRQATEFVKTWESVKPYVDNERYERQLTRFRRQARDAQWWRDACLLYFQEFSGKPLPPDSPAPQFTLKQLMDYHLNIDNYTSAPIDKLP
ncbi:MAG: alpha-glucuronidase [Bacteroidaceae bacterium]|nr:alpha-glucuronidase [Bacteroidaceae bacterium]